MSNSIQPIDMAKLSESSGNVYKTVSVLGRRANQIGAKLKHELNEKLAEFATSSDNLEEVVENREQIEIAKYYEAMPKPTLLAIDEYANRQVYFRDAEEA